MGIAAWYSGRHQQQNQMRITPPHNIDALIDRYWDAVIVGTGMGGATIGYALARSGQSVLFLEKGFARSSASLTGKYAEVFFGAEEVAGRQHRPILSAAGRDWSMLEDVSAKRSKTFAPFVGAGVGGSSALYGMALERFFPSDFEPRKNFVEVDETTVPERWPITYQELVPFYEQAEALFGLQGGRDPLRPDVATPMHAAPPLSAAGSELSEYLKTKGLHPYRLPMACKFVPGCASCQGYLCPNECKNDSARACLSPALHEYRAVLLDQCEVHRFQASADHVTALECSQDKRRFIVRGKTIVLAAGALASPALLLRSTSATWPDGLANRSGLVGRNLMRHLVDLYALRPTTRETWDNRRKELAFSDFYVHDGVRLGAVQSFGRLPPAPVLAAHLRKDLGEKIGTWAAKAIRLADPLLKPILGAMVERDMLLAGMVEDLPYPDNALTVALDGNIRIRYRMRAEAIRRVKLHRRLITSALEDYRIRLIKQAHNNEQLAHACGTCRFGDDAQTSVLDRNNRAHDLVNLFIVDGSFFPSSSGTNPALTIAANALRVAQGIIAGVGR
jgi:choline dehydrogenase-like flavoprotein